MSLQQLEDPPPYTNHLTAASFPSVPHGLLGVSAASSSPSVSHAAPLSSLLCSDLRNNTLPPLQGRQTADHVSLEPIRLPDVPTSVPRSFHLSPLSRPAEDVSRFHDSSLSAEDLIVAEALTDLRGFGSPSSAVSSPAAHVRALSNPTASATSPTTEPEPLLSLLKSSHPWLGTTIDGSLSAYNSTISYSPRFVQYGVNFVERNVGNPVASTVGQVGKRTGVEDRLRNYFDSRRPADTERALPTEEDAMDITSSDMARNSLLSLRSQRSSVESLPAYDESRSPPYEKDSAVEPHRRIRSEDHRTIARSWSTQLMITTSGLGVALSESSLRSLQFCLGILRNANTHVRNLMLALKQLLEEFEQTPLRRQRRRSHDLEKGHLMAQDRLRENGHDGDVDMDDANVSAEAAALAAGAHSLATRIRTLNDEIWNTLKTVVSAVSRYTGGALPDNASALVRGQLLSVPQRWRRAVSESAPLLGHGEQVGAGAGEQAVEGDTASNAHRMLAFAGEGLDMIAKVGGVVESTIVSAERWLDTIGRRKPADESPVAATAGHTTGNTTTAGGVAGAGTTMRAASSPMTLPLPRDVKMPATAVAMP